MPTATIQIKNGTITLPPTLRERWREAETYLRSEGDTIVIKKLALPSMSFKEMLSEMRQAARKAKLSTRDVTNAIREVRGEMYE